MLSQYLCGTETPDSAHIVHEVQIPDRNGEMQRVRVIIDCGVTSIFMAPRLLKRLWISGGTHHHPRHDRRCDATCKGQPEDADYSPVRGLSRTGRQIRHASRANAGVRFSTCVTMVSQTKSWHRLGSINSLRSPSASGAEEWHRWLRRWHRRSWKPKMTSFWGAVRVYRHLEQPHSTIF